MARLFGAQRMVLQAMSDAQGDTRSFIEDSRIAQATKISLRDMRDWFLTLDNDEYVDLALTESGMSASVTAKGRLALGLYQPFPDPRRLRASPVPEPDWSGAGPGHRHQRLPAAHPKAPRRRQRRAGDGDPARLGQGAVPRPERPAASPTPKRPRRRSSRRSSPRSRTSSRTTPCSLTWLGTVRSSGASTTLSPTTRTSRTSLPAACRSRRSRRRSTPRRARGRFLWLDFCHSGGIIPRDLTGKRTTRMLSRGR